MLPCGFQFFKDPLGKSKVNFLSKQGNVKATLRIIETKTCWQKLLFVINKYLLQRVVTLHDPANQTAHLYNHKAQSFIWKQSGKKVTANYVQHIDTICQNWLSPSQCTTIKMPPPPPNLESTESPSASSPKVVLNLFSGTKTHISSKPLKSQHSETTSTKSPQQSSSQSSSFHSSHKGSLPALTPIQLLRKQKVEQYWQNDELTKLLKKQERNNQIAEIASLHLDAFSATCYDSNGELNNEVERRKVLANPWGATGKSPDALRKKAQEIWQRCTPDEPDIVFLNREANELIQEADEIQKDHDEYMANEFQKTFFPCRANFADVTKEQLLTDATADFATPLTLYHGTKPGIVARIFAHNAFFTDTGKPLDSGAGAYFTTTLDNALGYAWQEEDVLKCEVKPGKIARIKHDGALWELSSYFSAMASFYIADHVAEISKNLQDHKITQNPVQKNDPEMGEVLVQLHNKIMRLFFTRLGFDTVYSPSSSRAGGTPYFNVLHLTPANITILT